MQTVAKLKKDEGSDMSSEERELVSLVEESEDQLMEKDFAERWEIVRRAIVKVGSQADILLGTVHQVSPDLLEVSLFDH